MKSHRELIGSEVESLLTSTITDFMIALPGSITMINRSNRNLLDSVLSQVIVALLPLRGTKRCVCVYVCGAGREVWMCEKREREKREKERERE